MVHSSSVHFSRTFLHVLRFLLQRVGRFERVNKHQWTLVEVKTNREVAEGERRQVISLASHSPVSPTTVSVARSFSEESSDISGRKIRTKRTNRKGDGGGIG